MLKFNFLNDYSEGAHPRILAALGNHNLSQESGYGLDSQTARADQLIRKHLNNPAAGVHLISGGTQANLIVLAAMLRPYEAVIAPDCGHISIHEAGAIEATGHKIISVPTPDGKLSVALIREVIEMHSNEHMVVPRVVFLSNASELGTVYCRQDLSEISKFCREHGLKIYLDGARLAMALVSDENDLSLSDIANLTDAFYIGATKNGALFGEAIVINDSSLNEHFRWHLKQRGALLAKGRILGTQFVELFTDDLWFSLAKHANRMAGEITQALSRLGVQFLTRSRTNQIFPILDCKVVTKLKALYGFYEWKKISSEKVAIRLVTSWATPEQVVQEFIKDCAGLI